MTCVRVPIPWGHSGMSELWNRALDEIKQKMTEENFALWFEPVRFVSMEDDAITLRIPSQFHSEWISRNYLDLILASLTRETGSTALRVKWEIDGVTTQDDGPSAPASSRRQSQPPPPPRNSPSRPPAPLPSLSADLNPKYHFGNFVVGPSNQLAHAASSAAASSPGTRYNPLFIYGGVGLGKTHLVNAIGHRIVQAKPGARILYLSAERFTNEFIWALQNHQINEFRERYRSRCDVLLMDDIQFLAGREQTQEEFFHTFNTLYHNNKQIVVTSDVYPQQIAEMEERLISRFQSGMVADIQAPELDTRIAILRKKAEQEKIQLADDVALYIAQVVKSNVRELEGSLLRLAVKAELLQRPIDIELAKETLRAALATPEHAATVEDVQRAVCEFFNIRLIDLKSHRRHRTVSFPRMVAMYLCRQRLGTSYPELGENFGGKDHTTVMSAVKKISGLVEEDPRVREQVAHIERKLGA